MIDKELYERDVSILENRYIKKHEYPVVFYGSSSIRLWNNIQKDFPEYEILNLGFGGARLEYCIYYFDRLVKPLRIRSFIFYAGDNDIGDGGLPDEIFDLFKEFYSKFRNHFPDTRFTYVSIKPSPDRFPAIDRMQITNRLIKNFLEKEENTFYLNIFDSMLNNNGNVREELFTKDKLHMNRRGYLLWKKKFIENSENVFA